MLQSTPVRSYQDRQSPFSSLNLPNIKQLREFPNLSAPVLAEQGKSVIVRLPHSAPVSPVKSNQSNCSIKSGDPITPTRSPELGVSVILANPTLVPAPPLPKFSTPTRNVGSPVVGSWDNFLKHPTYQNCDEIFWETRNKNTYKIPMLILAIWRDGRFSRNRGPLFGSPAHTILLRKRSANLHPKN